MTLSKLIVGKPLEEKEMIGRIVLAAVGLIIVSRFFIDWGKTDDK